MSLSKEERKYIRVVVEVTAESFAKNDLPDSNDDRTMLRFQEFVTGFAVGAVWCIRGDERIEGHELREIRREVVSSSSVLRRAFERGSRKKSNSGSA